MPILLGCIADDFTGATDAAGVLVKGGMRCVQVIGVPPAGLAVPEADAVVVALKSRSIEPAEAVRQSLDALHWLRSQGAGQILFKYCSTFDSTPRGNIGPVTDALMEALGTDRTIVCPGYPSYGRTIWRGHLFVGDRLLNESGMEKHPLNPMTDADLVRWMQAQSKGKVGLVRHAEIAKGAAGVRAALDAMVADGCRYAVTDLAADSDLLVLGEACADLPLITGGSGIALGLPANFIKAGRIAGTAADALPAVDGLEAVLSGSCSNATRGQVERMRASRPSFRLDPQELAKGDGPIHAALAFAQAKLADGPVLIYATAEPEEVKAAQGALGQARAGEVVEHAMAALAKGLVGLGVRRLVVAGGETSGSVVTALDVKALRIGPHIAPGVPATVTLGGTPLALALKSGNFGGPDFFAQAFAAMPGARA